MATCPNCLAKSREDPNALELRVNRDDEPVQAGEMEFFNVLVTPLRLVCNRCGWSVRGFIQGDAFLADPSTQVYPEGGSP